MKRTWTKTVLQLLVVPSVLAGAASCMLETDLCACTRAEPFVALQGTVQDSLGAALEGVSVSLAIGDPSCDRLTIVHQAVSDTVGVYLVAGGGSSEGTAACAELEALRFLATSVDTVRHEGLAVTFGFEQPLAVDLVFPVR